MWSHVFLEHSVERAAKLKPRNGKKFEIFSNFLAHPVKTPWPISTVLHQSVRRSAIHIGLHLASLRKIEMVAVLCTNETTPQFFDFLTSPPPHPPGADGHHRGRGHVGRHCPYTNNIWCGSVQALLRCRSKTAKMQKFPIDSHSNEKFICPLFRPPGAANHQKGRRHIRNHSTPVCELWRESARGLSRNRWPNKHTKIQKKHTVKQIPRPSLY